ncbi:unnamed protein product [Prorocentrum cordatum]|uniref:Uncharacterized protein n=1 Tax=Prorocentrum cordatum TaxID=2364126 RepID=A0ABN9U4H2_9DINO|nr:unnamed protein product [Polarella glacialis]
MSCCLRGRRNGSCMKIDDRMPFPQTGLARPIHDKYAESSCAQISSLRADFLHRRWAPLPERKGAPGRRPGGPASRSAKSARGSGKFISKCRCFFLVLCRLAPPPAPAWGTEKYRYCYSLDLSRGGASNTPGGDRKLLETSVSIFRDAE